MKGPATPTGAMMLWKAVIIIDRVALVWVDERRGCVLLEVARQDEGNGCTMRA